jgi:hypothetical protein
LDKPACDGERALTNTAIECRRSLREAKVKCTQGENRVEESLGRAKVKCTRENRVEESPRRAKVKCTRENRVEKSPRRAKVRYTQGENSASSKSKKEAYCK